MQQTSPFYTALEHVKKHMQYPGTKRQLIESCNNMIDIPAEDREWFAKNLPDRTYNNALDVLGALLDKV